MRCRTSFWGYKEVLANPTPSASLSLRHQKLLSSLKARLPLKVKLTYLTQPHFTGKCQSGCSDRCCSTCTDDSPE